VAETVAVAIATILTVVKVAAKKMAAMKTKVAAMKAEVAAKKMAAMKTKVAAKKAEVAAKVHSEKFDD
jgi:hypothetical protein